MRALLAAVVLGVALAPAAALAQTDDGGLNGHGEFVERGEGAEFDEAIFIEGADAVNRISIRMGRHITGHWEFVPNCIQNGAAGEEDVECVGFSVGCPPGWHRYQIYWVTVEGGRQQVDVRCVDLTRVRRGTDTAQAAEQAFKDMPLVAGAPTIAHESVPLVDLATYHQVTGPQILHDQHLLDFIRLDVTATAEYRWVFDGGRTMTTNEQGRRFREGDNPRVPPGPADAIMHWYPTPGAKTTTVATVWTATYTVTVGGATGPVLDVDGEVALPAQEIDFDVHEAHAVLYS